MNFDYTPKVQALREKLLAFFDEHIYPNEQAFYAEIARNRQNGNAWLPTELIEQLKQKARDAGLWNLFLPDSRARRRPDESRIRAAVRDHGPRALGAGSVQLQRARHRQHGNDRALRQRRQQARVARTAAARPDPLGVSDDRAGSGVVGCDQYPDQHRARRRLLRDQRPQVVVVRRGRSALQDLSSSWARPIRKRRATSSSR